MKEHCRYQLLAREPFRLVNTATVENSPNVTHVIAITTLRTQFLITRCLNGRNVACIRSNEITARFIKEAKRINSIILYIMRTLR